MQPESDKCWICGGAGTTGEHRQKRSDLKGTFRKPTQTNPIYLSDTKRRNRELGSFDNKRLKFTDRLCPKCNNERSQPFDRAWECMSDKLRSQGLPLATGSSIRANTIFKYDTKKNMLRVHLFFIKLFGCHIVEQKIPIDVSAFAHAFMNAKSHPLVYLRFCYYRTVHKEAGSTNLICDPLQDGSCAFASWFYEVDGLSVNVMFAVEGESREGLVGAWHPKFGTKRLVIHDFDA